jgi:Ca2+/H+ antiporter, TMEM165/GDT1 family
MGSIIWNSSTPAVGAAFAASLVEAVEALTIVLAVATLRGWRPPALGAAAGLLTLGALVCLFGPLLEQVSLHLLQLFVGVLLLLFGMGWLRKAILRAAGFLPLHDESAVFLAETGKLAEAESRSVTSRAWIAGVTAFKAVLLEGLEVVFIVLAVGSGHGRLWPAALGALAACATVLAVGAAVRKPLVRVPENTLKFGVGVLLSAFGMFWTGEGLGIPWPGQDLALAAFAAMFLLAALLTVSALRRPSEEVAS